MAQLVDLYGFLSVLANALAIVAQTLAMGGVIFALLVARPLRLTGDETRKGVLRSIRRLVSLASVGLALAQIVILGLNSATLMATADLSLGEIAGANFFRAALLSIAASSALALIVRIRFRRMWHCALAIAVLIIGSSVMTSHAASRLTDQALLAAATALHVAATAAWIGGLPYLLLVLSRCSDDQMRETITRRFSRLAIAGVSLIAAAGLTLSLYYIDAPGALYGTAYGVMLGAKILLFSGLLLLGALNFFTVRRLRKGSSAGFDRLRPVVEVEVALGFVLILAATSLTSVPPAADLTIGRVSLAEISARMSPHWPRLRSPDVKELSEPTRQVLKRAPAGVAVESVLESAAAHRNPRADNAWSEYNHHWAGLLVLLAGLLQVAHWTGRAKWARHWPLVFLGLAAFIFLRADPENWPLGPNGFWESFDNSEVLQHRSFAALAVAFGLFQWAVVTNRIRSVLAALVFPLICLLGGALLLTHSHSLGNVKEELLAELIHVPLALFAVAAGGARWLELRLPPSDRRIPSLVGPICFVLIGLLLLYYRES